MPKKFHNVTVALSILTSSKLLLGISFRFFDSKANLLYFTSLYRHNAPEQEMDSCFCPHYYAKIRTVRFSFQQLKKNYCTRHLTVGFGSCCKISLFDDV